MIEVKKMIEPKNNSNQSKYNKKKSPLRCKSKEALSAKATKT